MKARNSFAISKEIERCVEEESGRTRFRVRVGVGGSRSRSLDSEHLSLQFLMDFNRDINHKAQKEERKGGGGKPGPVTTTTTTTTKSKQPEVVGHEESRNCKVHPLLQLQRLQIPNKEKEYQSNSNLENKPLVQWESSDESEEELSFFPAGKSRGVLTDNLSIDSQSMEEEDEDLHLSAPRQEFLSGKSCCCCECIVT